VSYGLLCGQPSYGAGMTCIVFVPGLASWFGRMATAWYCSVWTEESV